MDEVKREMRQILIGNIVPKGKYYEVPEKGLSGLRMGVTDSADMILIFGVARHTRYYVPEGNPNKIKADGHKALMNIGRKVIIRSNPNAEVTFCRYMVTRPIVLLFEIDDIGVKVETYTARGISGLISELWIRWKFMKEMPELQRLDKTKLKEIYSKKAEEERRIAEEKKKAEEEERKKADEAAKKAEEERKKKEALEAIENVELTDEDIEAIIASRAKDKLKKQSIEDVNLPDEDSNPEPDETEAFLQAEDEEIPDLIAELPDNPPGNLPDNSPGNSQKKPSLRGAKRRFQKPPKLSYGDEKNKQKEDS